MNKKQFLSKLESSLKSLPAHERQDILQDFEEHFAIGLQEGKTEEQMSASLGSPHQIAKDMVAAYHLERVETKATFGNILRAVWATIGLGFFNLAIVLGPFIALAGIIFSGWITGIVFMASPFLFLINILLYPETFTLFYLFVSIATCGIGFFVVIGMYFATRTLMQGFIRYLRWNVNLIKGGLKNG
ncbi:UNVERIFIED_ORG: putative membrane protein [Heyndrickxia coagulans]